LNTDVLTGLDICKVCTPKQADAANKTQKAKQETKSQGLISTYLQLLTIWDVPPSTRPFEHFEATLRPSIDAEELGHCAFQAASSNLGSSRMGSLGNDAFLLETLLSVAKCWF